MKQAEPLVSIIVPVYKVEKYLPKCIDSILAQTMTDFELILIDDGSPDLCGEICDNFQTKDARIRVVHQENAGVSKARNVGLSLAKGDWISFVDSDDYLAPNAYELLMRCASLNDCDMAIMDFAYVDESGIVLPGRERNYGDVEYLDNKELFRKQFDIPLTIRLAMSNKVVKRNVLHDLKFDENLRCSEDTLFLSQCIERVNRAVYVKQLLYYNVQRDGSAMHGALRIYDFEQSLHIHKQMAEKAKKLYPDIYDYAYVYYIDACIWKMRSFPKHPNGFNREEYKKYSNCHRRMRSRIRSEYSGILRCSSLSWKQKISYFIIGVTG